MRRIILILIAFAATGCQLFTDLDGYSWYSDTDSDTDSTPQYGTGSSDITVVDSDADTSSDSSTYQDPLGTDTDSGTYFYTDSASGDKDTGFASDSSVDAGSESDTDSDTDTESETTSDTDTSLDSDFDTETETISDAGSDNVIDTDSFIDTNSDSYTDIVECNPPCDDDLKCAEHVCRQGSCEYEIRSNYCLIGNECYEHNSSDPNNECRYCDVDKSNQQWTNYSKAVVCNDMDECNGDDHCDGSGSCSIHEIAESDATFECQCSADGHWYDANSDLCWQDPPAMSGMTWEQAESYCNDHLWDNRNDDWQLPDITDLTTLLRGCSNGDNSDESSLSECLFSDCGVNGCWDGEKCASCEPFDGCYWDSGLGGVCTTYWSSSYWAGGTCCVWHVSFNTGSVSNVSTTNLNYARCVRHRP